jgi:hypothetical protein
LSRRREEKLRSFIVHYHGRHAVLAQPQFFPVNVNVALIPMAVFSSSRYRAERLTPFGSKTSRAAQSGLKLFDCKGPSQEVLFLFLKVRRNFHGLAHQPKLRHTNPTFEWLASYVSMLSLFLQKSLSCTLDKLSIYQVGFRPTESHTPFP